MSSGEDYRKYFCALGSRSIRRVAARVCVASELDHEVRTAMLGELTQALSWQRMAAIAGWRFNDHTVGGEDGEDRTVEIDFAVYSNGQPVFTVVDWTDGYATVVHHPDSLRLQDDDIADLAEEICPCCGGMPST